MDSNETTVLVDLPPPQTPVETKDVPSLLVWTPGTVIIVTWFGTSRVGLGP